MRKFVKLFLILLSISLVIDVLFLINTEWDRIAFADAFFVTSIVFLGFGAYSFVASKGMFASFSYSMRKLGHILFRPKQEYTGPKTLFEHQSKIIENRKENRWTFVTMIVGLLQLVLSLIFAYLL